MSMRTTAWCSFSVLFVIVASSSPARAGVAPEACCRPAMPCIDLQWMRHEASTVKSLV